MSQGEKVNTRQQTQSVSVGLGQQRGLSSDEISEIIHKALNAVRTDIVALPIKEFLEEAISEVSKEFEDKLEEKEKEIESLKNRHNLLRLKAWKKIMSKSSITGNSAFEVITFHCQRKERRKIA